MTSSDEELLDYWKTNRFSNLAFSEIKDSLYVKEMELIRKETKNIVDKNKALGGSEHGFYYKSELFIVAGAYGKEGIEVVHPSLEEEAEHLKLNRTEIQQYTTYIAHMLSALDMVSMNNPTVYCANIPPGLFQLSDSLNRLNMYCQRIDGVFYKEATFKRDDKSKAAFFAHYDRVDNPINRFLFRRVVS